MKIFSSNSDLQTVLLNRFVRYVRCWSESSGENADKGIMPSTSQQKVFAKSLLTEIKTVGLKNAQLTADGYIYAVLPA